MNLKTKSGRRDFERMEERRMKAAALFERGLWPSEVARRLGTTRTSACRWHEAWRKQGAKALRAAGRAGRKPRLSETQVRQLEEGLKRGPEALGYATPLWTARRIAHLVRQQSGVSFHQDHIYRLLQRLGWSCQRPTGRAIERNEDAIKAWKRQRWPELKKKRSESAE